MPIKNTREYRALQAWELRGGEDSYIVTGRAVVFDTPTVLWTDPDTGAEYKEVIDRAAFAECDTADVIFNYNHAGKVVARTRNNTLRLRIEEDGLYIDADLSGTEEGRKLYEEIKGGYIDRMSFSFTILEDAYNTETRTRTVLKVRKLYDVSAVDIPAYEETSLLARRSVEEEHSAEVKAVENANRRKELILRTLL